MISKREFFSISIMMLMLLFMFQALMVIREYSNKYDVNEYYNEDVDTTHKKWEMEKVNLDNLKDEQDYILFVGKQDAHFGKMVSEWCTYTKRNCAMIQSITENHNRLNVLPAAVILESKYVNMQKELDIIEGWAEQGVDIIFCDLPDVEDVESNYKLQELLGIVKVESHSVEVDAIKVFEGLLLGGETIYDASKDEAKGMGFEMPWYVLGSGTKTYMVGMFGEPVNWISDVKNEYLPAIVWRNSVGDGKVFAVNADYMKDSTGIGFLSGFMAECNPIEIYPVINAQNLAVTNYPGFASENDEVIQKLYSRTQSAMFRDVVWPSLVSTVHNTDMKLTCFMTPQFDYTDSKEPKHEELVFYLKQLNEVGAEAGLSLQHRGGVTIEEKIERDNKYFSSIISNYKYRVVYLNLDNVDELLASMKDTMLRDVKSAVCKYKSGEPIIDYCGNGVIKQSVTNDGFSHTYKENLRMRSLQSALAYTNVVLDMNRVVWPEDERDQWHIVYESFSSNIKTYWSKFKMFESTTLSESTGHVNSFLTMDYDKSYKDGVVTVNITEKTGDCWFILRTHGESIVDIKGGDYKLIEDNAYLIKAEDSTVTIKIDREDEFYYYLP